MLTRFLIASASLLTSELLLIAGVHDGGPGELNQGICLVCLSSSVVLAMAGVASALKAFHQVWQKPERAWNRLGATFLLAVASYFTILVLGVIIETLARSQLGGVRLM